MLLKILQLAFILTLTIALSNATSSLLIGGIGQNEKSQKNLQEYAERMGAVNVPTYLGDPILVGVPAVVAATPEYEYTKDPNTGRIEVLDSYLSYDYDQKKDVNGLGNDLLNGKHYDTIYAHSGGTRTAVTAMMRQGVTAEKLVLISPIMGHRNEQEAYNWELQELLESNKEMNIVVYQSTLDNVIYGNLYQAKFDSTEPGIDGMYEDRFKVIDLEEDQLLKKNSELLLKLPVFSEKAKIAAHKQMWYTALKNELGSSPDSGLDFFNPDRMIFGLGELQNSGNWNDKRNSNAKGQPRRFEPAEVEVVGSAPLPSEAQGPQNKDWISTLFDTLGNIFRPAVVEAYGGDNQNKESKLGSTSDNSGTSIQQTSDGGYITVDNAGNWDIPSSFEPVEVKVKIAQESVSNASIRTLKGHFDEVYSIAFSPDGSILASGGNDGKIELWDVLSCSEIKTLEGNSKSISSVAFSPDGNILASSGSDGKVELWDVQTGTEIQTLKSRTANSIAFSPDGRTLASCGSSTSNYSLYPNTITLWDVLTGNETRKLYGGLSTPMSIAFSPDGQTIAVGGDFAMFGGFIQLWDVSTGTEIQKVESDPRIVFSIAFSPDGRMLASGGFDGIIRLCDVSTGAKIRTLLGHSDWVRSVAFSPDGHILASGDDYPFGGRIKLWDVSTGTEIQMLKDNTDRVTSVAFSPDGRFLASGSRDGIIHLWQMDREITNTAKSGDRSGSSESALSTTPIEDIIAPNVLSLIVTPSSNGQSLTLGESFKIDYAISDSGGSGLKQVELWRKDERSPWQEIKSDAVSDVYGPISGSFTDSPSAPGKYWYGLHVVDNAGNWNDEKNSNSNILYYDYTEMTVTPNTLIKLKDGYELTVKSIDVYGNRIYVELTKDGTIIEDGSTDVDQSYYYKKDVGSLKERVIIYVHFNAIFRGAHENLGNVHGIWQISERTSQNDVNGQIGPDLPFTAEVKNV